MSAIRRVLAAVTACALPATAIGALPAHAEPEASPQVLLVMDSSGSMAEPTGGGTTRIDAAKKALHSVIDNTPDDTELGLRVYGSHDNPKGSPESCKDSDLVVPIATDNRDQLRTEVDQYKPVGWTPIAHSLSEAGKDLSDEGNRTIVLVSDGEETCEVDPCDVAARLAEKGIDLTINTVGLNVSGKARENLQCIADKGKGEYYDAENADDLEEALNQATRRQGQEYQAEGEPVDGSDQPGSAPEIGEGTYTDDINGDTYYRVKRTVPGSTIWVGALSQGQDFTNRTYLKLFNEEEDQCAFSHHNGINYQNAASLHGVVTHSGQEPDVACDKGDVLVEISGTEEDRTMRLQVVEEPPATNVDEMPEPTGDDASPLSTRPGSPSGEPVRGGTSLESAPTLTPGSTTPVTLVRGEVQIFAVDLDWGQRLEARLTGQRTDGGPSEITRITTISPLGGDVHIIPEGASEFTLTPDVDIATTHPEVRYRNRESDDGLVQGASLPGRYYVVASQGVRSEAGSEGEERSMNLTVKVIDGDPHPEPAHAAPEPSELPAEPGSDASDPAGSGHGDGGSDNGTNWGLIAGLGGGAVLLAGLGVGALWFLRRL